MKRLLITLTILLTGVVTFAQEVAQTVIITRSVNVGAFREDKAVNYLQASCTVEAGATAHYTAGQSVTLQPGFVARAGSVFMATISNVTRPLSAEPGTTLLVRAFPNPFETTTTIEYQLPEALRVTQTLTDATGHLVRRSGGQEAESAGIHRTPLDLSHLPVGVYLYQVETGKGSQVLRLMKK